MSGAVRACGLAVIAGLTLFLAYAGWGLSFTALIGLVPLLAALEARSLRQALMIGFVAGWTFHLAGYYWLVGTFDRFGGFPLPICIVLYMLVTAWQAGQVTLFAVGHRWLRRRHVPALVAAPGMLVIAEWTYPLLFPSYLGAGLHELPVLIQAADIGGPLLLSALAVMVNVGLWRMLGLIRGDRAARTEAVVGCAVLVAMAGYGLFRIQAVERLMAAAPELRVGVVQSSVAMLDRRFDPEGGLRHHREQSLALQESHDPDLIIWPESGYFYVLPDGIVDLRRAVLGPDLHTPLIFGGARRDADDRTYNTAFLLDADGRIQATYDKTYLLAFGEYLPFGEIFPWLHELSPATGSMTRGRHLRPFELGEYRISVLICYEDLLPTFTRDVVRAADPHLLVNLTNDAWFGDSLEPWLHLALARLRSVEHHRFLVRATNTGVSAIIDPVGRITISGGVMTRESLAGTVRMMAPATPYGRLGNAVGWLALIGLGAVVWRGRLPTPAAEP